MNPRAPSLPSYVIFPLPPRSRRPLELRRPMPYPAVHGTSKDDALFCTILSTARTGSPQRWAQGEGRAKAALNTTQRLFSTVSSTARAASPTVVLAEVGREARHRGFQQNNRQCTIHMLYPTIVIECGPLKCCSIVLSSDPMCLAPPRTGCTERSASPKVRWIARVNLPQIVPDFIVRNTHLYVYETKLNLSNGFSTKMGMLFSKIRRTSYVLRLFTWVLKSKDNQHFYPSASPTSKTQVNPQQNEQNQR